MVKKEKQKGWIKVKDSKLDKLVYAIVCVCTFGLAGILKVIIAEAIRSSFETYEEEFDIYEEDDE